MLLYSPIGQQQCAAELFGGGRLQPELLGEDDGGLGRGTFHTADGGETKMDKAAKAAHLQCAGDPAGGDRAQRTGVFSGSRRLEKTTLLTGMSSFLS